MVDGVEILPHTYTVSVRTWRTSVKFAGLAAIQDSTIILNVMKCQKRSDLMNEVVVRTNETILGGIFVGRLTKVLPTCVMTWPCGHIQVVS